MKRAFLLTLCLVIGLTFIGCGKSDAPQNTAQLANPWQSFDSLDEAETDVGFALEMPQVIAGSYTASAFRVMHGEKSLLEVIYQDEDFEVVIRKAQGEGQDISGVYGFELTGTNERNGVEVGYYRPAGESETPNAVVIEFDCDGFSWSAYAPKGYWGDSCEDFLNAVLPISAGVSQGNESAETECPALIMVDGALYYDSSEFSTVEARCGMLDGTLDSMCDGNIPMQNNQSNFGTGYGYQVGAGRVEVLIDGSWHVFLPFDETDEQWHFLFGDNN